MDKKLEKASQTKYSNTPTTQTRRKEQLLLCCHTQECRRAFSISDKSDNSGSTDFCPNHETATVFNVLVDLNA